MLQGLQKRKRRTMNDNTMEKLIPKELTPESRACLERYLISLSNLKSMLKKGIISDRDFIKAESLIAEKNSIKKISIYRPNDLINSPFRAMYIHGRKEE